MDLFLLILVLTFGAIIVIGLLITITFNILKKFSNEGAKSKEVDNRIFGYLMRKINVETNTYSITMGTLGIAPPDLVFVHGLLGGNLSSIVIPFADIINFEASNEREADYRKDYLTEEHYMATFIIDERGATLIGNIGGNLIRRIFSNKNGDINSILAGNFYVRHMLRDSGFTANRWETYRIKVSDSSSYWFFFRNTLDNMNLIEQIRRYISF
jgi:Flp pilus assembly pilin Flp